MGVQEAMAVASQGRATQEPWMSSLAAPMKVNAASRTEPERLKRRQRPVDGAHGRGQEKAGGTAFKIPAAGGPNFTLKWGDKIIISKPLAEIPRGAHMCPVSFLVR